jgi:Leucine rich repeat
MRSASGVPDYTHTTMDTERGDDYLRNIASFIRTNESRLAEAAFQRPRRLRQPAQPAPTGLTLNPLQWFSSDSTQQPTRPKPLTFIIDTHHLFYILIRLEALGYNVGSLDVKAVRPSRPMNYIDVFHGEDTSDAISLSSIRTSLSSVSRLSLGLGLWARPEPPSMDQELKYIFSCFTKIPALSLRAPGPKTIVEIAADPPNENALPLDSFRNLQSLECIDIDPRTLLGWCRLSESLYSLTVKRSGLDDISDLFIDAVADDASRRQATSSLGTVDLSRRSSFHSTRLPETIAENAEETVVAPTSDDPSQPPSPTESSTSPQLPSSKWAFLRHLSLADNALTFIPTESLMHLTSLTHLDLSSNLLVSIPSGLSSLYNLVSLNLSDNMIDSVLGIYKMLGQVLALNLSRNRLDSLCGLERLMALERVDVRHNQLEESGEVGRLSLLPNITEVWVEGNPFTEIESDYRVRCFDFFWKEGRTILLDGTQAGFYEKMNLTSPPPEQMSSTRPRPMPKANSPPVVPVGVAAAAVVVPPAASGGASSSSSPTFSPTSSHHPSPHLTAASAKPRKKRMKRIVDLDAESGANVANPWLSGSEEPSESSSVPAFLMRSPREEPTLLPSVPEPDPAPLPSEDSMTPRESAIRSTPPSKHRRSQTDYVSAPIIAESNDAPPSPVLSRLPHEGTLSVRVSARRSAARRARVAASVFEAPSPKADKGEEGIGREIKEADAFRAQVEALRSEMGDGWLKVFSQSHTAASTTTRPAAERAGASR